MIVTTSRGSGNRCFCCFGVFLVNLWVHICLCFRRGEFRCAFSRFRTFSLLRGVSKHRCSRARSLGCCLINKVNKRCVLLCRSRTHRSQPTDCACRFLPLPPVPELGSPHSCCASNNSNSKWSAPIPPTTYMLIINKFRRMCASRLTSLRRRWVSE